MLLFNTVLCLALACIISVAPVLAVSKMDLQAVLRSGHAAGGSKPSIKLFSILIVSEAAFAFLLLAGSGLMIRSLIRLQEADHGFRPDHVLTMRLPVGSLRQLQASGKYDTRPRQMAYYHELVERLHRVPGVRAVAVVNNLPLSDINTSLIQQGPHGEEVEIAARTWRPRFSARIFSVLGTMALLLTSAGVYGVVAYTTGQDPRGRNPRSARGQPARRIWCNASKCDDPLGRRSGRQPRGRLAVEPSVDERSL